MNKFFAMAMNGLASLFVTCEKETLDEYQQEQEEQSKPATRFSPDGKKISFSAHKFFTDEGELGTYDITYTDQTSPLFPDIYAIGLTKTKELAGGRKAQYELIFGSYEGLSRHDHVLSLFKNPY